MRFSYAQIFTASTAALFIVVMFTHFGTDNGLSGVGSTISESLVRGSVKSSMAKSESLWEKTVKQRHEILGAVGDVGLFPATGAPSYFTYPYSVWDFVPASWSCPFEVERIGRMGDGGKWVCGMSRYEKNQRPLIIYSFGVQNESSFEQEMLERTNCFIWGYDFSVEAFGPALVEPYRSRTKFLQAGINGQTDTVRNPPYYNIQDLMAKNGHTYIDILKIDIEFFEFSTLTSLIKFTRNGEFPIGQMLLEIHLFGHQDSSLPVFIDWWESLEQVGMRATWTEPNLLAVTMKLEDGNPRLAEYSLVNVMSKSNKLFN